MGAKNATFFCLMFTSCSLLSSCTTAFFYHPTREHYYDPAVMGFQVEERNLASSDGLNLHGIFLRHAKAAQDRRTVILFLHGNGENLSSHFLAVAWLANIGYDLLLFDYRGYGLSDGEFDHDGSQEDALAMVREGARLSGEQGKRFIVYGQSLGGVLATRALLRWQDEFPVEYARKRPVLLVLDSTFGSYRGIAKDKLQGGCLWVLRPLTYILVSDSDSVADRVRELSPLPLLFVHSETDDVVPIRFGQALFLAAGEPKYFLSVPRASHGGWPALGRSAAAHDFARLLVEMTAPDFRP